MASPLHLKLRRDLWRLRGQVLSIALVVAAGVSVVVTFRSNLDSLAESRDRYYRVARFAEVFASLKRAPEPVAGRVARLEGVAAVETRVVVPVTLSLPAFQESVSGRLVSLPARAGAGLNRVHLRVGRMPRGHREALVSEQFARAQGLRPGDRIGVVVSGRWQSLEVAGIALSPEYVYAAMPGALITDNKRFGVLWMNREALAAAYGMTGAFNDLTVRLAPGGSAEAVIAGVDRVLGPYGGTGAYPRRDQASDHVIADEIRQNQSTGTVIPLLILGVAAFLLNVVLARLVATEREQVGVLKAFGYADREVGWHYLSWALAAVLLGVALGIVAGIWLGKGMIGLYEEHFRFPELRYRVSWPLVLGAVALSAAAAGVGALGSVRRAVRLPPAEAMRPEPPARFATGVLERMVPAGLLTPSGRIVLRNLTRRPARTAIAITGVGFAVSLMVVVMLFFEAFGRSFQLQFTVAQRQDLTLGFDAARADAVRHDLAHLTGVRRVELFRSVPARLHSGHRRRAVLVTGMEARPRLSRVMSASGAEVAIPARGLLLTQALAGVLGVRPGDSVRVEFLEGERRTVPLPVAATADELFGTAAYMEAGQLARVLGETPSASGAHLQVDADRLAALHALLAGTPRVAAVTSPAAMLANFQEHVARNLNLNLLIISLFAGVIAIGVVYNGARISLSERGRELASLRVMGFTRHEVAVILLGEQAVVTLLGLPAGCLLGLAYARIWAASLSGEVYRIQIAPDAGAFLLSSAVVLLMAVLAGIAVRLRIAHLDLIAVLKTRE